jgi:hypothetical protein
MNDEAHTDTTESTTEIVITKKIKTDHQPQTVGRKSQYHDFECTKGNIDNEIDRLRIDEVGLKLFQIYITGKRKSFWGKRWHADLSEEEKDRCADKGVVAALGWGRIDVALEKLEEHMFSRVALITDGLDTNLTHTLDVKALHARVEELFGWFESKNHRKYIGPYFPLIQSCGMGKTRLLMELRNLFKQSEVGQRKEEERYDCFTILCEKLNDTYLVEKGYYDGTISLCYDDCRDHTEDVIFSRLCPLICKATATRITTRIVLLFDEAQNLLEYQDGYAFRRIRWYLRYSWHLVKIVAVFAGTTLNLTNLFDNEHPPGSSCSGDYLNYDERRGKSPKQMYPPFFKINTIGCFGNRQQIQDSTELEKAAYYGRPLFASLQTKGELLMEKTLEGNVASNSNLHVVLTRMLLSRPSWQVDDRALYNILGTRVQMGVTMSSAVASDLVEHAYANLIFFYRPIDEGDNIGPIARVAFLPDPVCAALAMGLMVPEWELKSHRHGNAGYKGQDPTFWSRKAADLFVRRVCFPRKGDGSEVMVALYMLFCGDGLRMKRDPKLHTFSVSLLEWYMKLKHPTAHDSKVEQEHEARGAHTDADKAPTLVMEVNFIQICSNFSCENSRNDEHLLERLYKSAVASYMFSEQEEIDFVCAIRLTVGPIIAYLPLLVSVKCWTSIERQDVDSWIHDMKCRLDEVRKDEGKPQLPVLCLFVVVGVESVQAISHESNIDDLGNFPNEDVFRVVVVPKNDPFDISANLDRISHEREMVEVYMSHEFAFTGTANPEQRTKEALQKIPNSGL